MREIAFTRKEPHKGATLLRRVIADRSQQHRVGCFNRIEHSALRYRSIDINLNFALNMGQRTQMPWQQYTHHHDSVCTSTESTAGRSRTIGFQLSPASGDI